MTLREFRELTADLAGDLELLVAGGCVATMRHDDDWLVIDDDNTDAASDDVVLYHDYEPVAVC